MATEHATMVENGEIVELVARHREVIARRWCESIIAGYPERTAAFLRDQQNPFANPVGAAVKEATTEILDGVIEGCDDAALAPALDRIIRIRAVQDFTPAQAVGFVFELKPILREALAEELSRPGVREGLLAFEATVDRLALAAFNVFMECREQVCSIRIEEIRKRSLDAWERLNAWRERRTATDAEHA